MTQWENFKDAARFGATAAVGLAGLLAGLGAVTLAIAAALAFVGYMMGFIQ